MKISEIMTLEVETAAPDDTIQTAAQMMADGGVGVLPVCDGARLVGMITDRDIAVRAVAEGKTPGQCSVRDVMTEDLNYALEDDEVQNVAQKMGQWQVHRLPVLDREKQLVGIVSLGAISRSMDRTARPRQGQPRASFSRPATTSSKIGS